MSAQQPAVVHIDADGMSEIARGHDWPWHEKRDSLFETGVPAMLDLLDAEKVRGTFFVIANSLDDPRKRDLLQEVARRGHEIASHSLSHPLLRHESSETKRREIAESRERLESELGVSVRGFRAPGYQIDRECIELLAEYGYRYDSSAFPTKEFSQRLGVPVELLEGPRQPFEGLGLVELPLPDHRPSPVPINPSYSLLLGERYFRWGLARAERLDRPFVLLFHLIDVAEPLPDEFQRGLRRKIFTLSLQSAESKRRRCATMLEHVSERFQMTTSLDLIDRALSERAA